MLDSFIGNGTPGYDIAIYRYGECIFRRTEGYSDMENQIPMNGSELYYIYSCSKMITVTAALQLWEKGLFDLDDEVSKYVPEFKTMYVKTEDLGIGETVDVAKEDTATEKDKMRSNLGV